MKEILVGLLGFGTIGTGVVKLLKENQKMIERKSGVKIRLKRIADLDVKRDRGVRVEEEMLTTSSEEIIADPEISIIIELIGGYEPARTFILKSIEGGKNVVTANKALLSLYGEEIFRKAKEKGVSIGFEGSVGGGIPIIKAIKEGLAANNISSIWGILNGTSNYILSEMTERSRELTEVLKEAQKKGYAETDPRLDVEGMDACHKLVLLISLAYGVNLRPEDIYVEGISKITPLDVQYAKELGYKIKLLAISKKGEGEIEARGHPTLLPENHLLSKIEGTYNAIFIHGDAVSSTMFYGQGAGMMPTASSVVSDVIEISKRIIQGQSPEFYWFSLGIQGIKVKKMGKIKASYYLRFTVLDQPGVLSKISGILGKHNISISSVIQKGREGKAREGVPIFMLTHEAKEKEIQKALAEINTLPVTLKEPLLIRIEDKLGD